MKKIFAIIMTACLLASLLSVTAFAADAPAEGVVLRVSALKRDDTTVVIQDYRAFEDGWNAAMELAVNSKALNANDYARVIVDIYADWNANDDGEFTEDFFNGKGFNWDAIYFQPNVRMTLNLNGYTINRGLTEWEYNGEVMYIDSRADVIINDGTITGGFSCNGAGGIHVNGANVTLNNVNVVGNTVDDDDGAGIALYNGATLTMNGGSIADNKNNSMVDSEGAGVYVCGSTAVFESVTFRNNQNTYFAHSGTALGADQNSAVTMNKCEVIDNGMEDDALGYCGSISAITIDGDSRIDIIDTNFTGNGAIATSLLSAYLSYLIDVNSTSHCYIDNCTFTNNLALYLFSASNEDFEVVNSRFQDNTANVFIGYGDNEITFTDCTFSNNAGSQWKGYYSFNLTVENAKLTFNRCDLGDSTFNDHSRVTFDTSCVGSVLGDASETRVSNLRFGSMIGQGNLSMLLSLLAIFTACAALGVVISKNKKQKEIPVVAGVSDEDNE